VAVALRSCRRRVRSTRDVLTLLHQQGFPRATAEQAVAICQARGLLDDAACARLWAETWARRGYAWSAIRAKLSEKGLGAAAIARAAGWVQASAGDAARAREVAERLWRRQTGSRRRPAVARALAGRGFDPDLIEQILDASGSADPMDVDPHGRLP
jgi:SOS response regulatory protein OraA/RecX